MERIVRVTSAFSGLGIAAMQAVSADLKRERQYDRRSTDEFEEAP